ncbi:hypothetical protein Tco_0833736 [Tanacetum coccineum]
MEEDYEPTVQDQRRVNPKIHDVIKKEVEKLLDAGLIYPISDSPWGGDIVYTDHSAIKYLFAKKDAKPRLDALDPLSPKNSNVSSEPKKEQENLAADHLSSLKNPHKKNSRTRKSLKHFLYETLDRLLIELIDTPWICRFRKLPCRGIYLVKGMSTQ